MIKIFRFSILIFSAAALTFIPMFLMNTLFGVSLREVLCRAAVMLILMIFLLLVNALLAKTIFRILGIILSSVVFFLAILLQILEFYNFATVGQTFGMNFYATMFDIKLLLDLAPSQGKQIALCILYLSLSSAAFCLLAIHAAQSENKYTKVRIFAVVFFFLLLGIAIYRFPNPAVNFVKMFNLAKLHDVSDKIDIEYFKKHGILHCPTTKDTLKIYDKGIGKNLVFIILESMEKNFLDEELFPGLTPNLNRFRKMPGTLFFNDITDSAGFTNGAIFQFMYGMPPTPLTLPLSYRGVPHRFYLRNFLSLPYLFTKSGYNWTHITQDYSLDELFLGEKAMPHFKKEVDLKATPWRDDTTFEAAWEIFKKRSKEAVPFAISVLSLDGHMPNGFVSERTLTYPNKKFFPEQYQHFQLLNANYNCDYHLGILVDRILTSPQGKNTIIVIANDHLFMGSAGKVLDKKKRKNMLMIINGGKNGISDTPGCNLDISSTIVDLFKIKSNYKFPCGVSLLTDLSQTSVKERMNICRSAGVELLNKYIVSKSKPLETKKENKNINVINRDGMFYLHIFDQEIALRNNSELLRVDFDKNNSIKAATYFRDFFGYETEKRRTKAALDDKNSYIFLFRDNSVTSNQIFEYLIVPQFPMEWCLLYKRSDGKIMAAFAPDLHLLSLDTSQMEKQNVTLIFYKLQVCSLQYDDFRSWSPIKKIDNEKIAVTGKNSYIFSKYSFVSPGKNESFGYSGTVKNTGNESVELTHGFALLDKDNKPLVASHYPRNADVGCAEIIRANAGEKSIIIQGSPKAWRNGRLAINAKPDYSDVPNYKTTKQTISKITRLSDGNTKVALNAPLSEAIPVGTMVRPHGIGGYLDMGVKTLKPGETLNNAGDVKKSENAVFYSTKALPRGCRRIELLILSFSKKSGAENTIEISNYKVMRK